ncbi:hypothetical protein VTO73DRAFT_7730 [Trametes versicolor]
MVPQRAATPLSRARISTTSRWTVLGRRLVLATQERVRERERRPVGSRKQNGGVYGSWRTRPAAFGAVRDEDAKPVGRGLQRALGTRRHAYLHRPALCSRATQQAHSLEPPPPSPLCTRCTGLLSWPRRGARRLMQATQIGTASVDGAPWSLVNSTAGSMEQDAHPLPLSARSAKKRRNRSAEASHAHSERELARTAAIPRRAAMSFGRRVYAAVGRFRRATWRRRRARVGFDANAHVAECTSYHPPPPPPVSFAPRLAHARIRPSSSRRDMHLVHGPPSRSSRACISASGKEVTEASEADTVPERLGRTSEMKNAGMRRRTDLPPSRACLDGAHGCRGASEWAHGCADASSTADGCTDNEGESKKTPRARLCVCARVYIRLRGRVAYGYCPARASLAATTRANVSAAASDLSTPPPARRAYLRFAERIAWCHGLSSEG